MNPNPSQPSVSAVLSVKIGGRSVVLSLRDHDEVRLLSRVESLLQRYPRADEEEEEPEATAPPKEYWCSIHEEKMEMQCKEAGVLLVPPDRRWGVPRHVEPSGAADRYPALVSAPGAVGGKPCTAWGRLREWRLYPIQRWGQRWVKQSHCMALCRRLPLSTSPAEGRRVCLLTMGMSVESACSHGQGQEPNLLGERESVATNTHEGVFNVGTPLFLVPPPYRWRPGAGGSTRGAHRGVGRPAGSRTGRPLGGKYPTARGGHAAQDASSG